MPTALMVVTSSPQSPQTPSLSCMDLYCQIPLPLTTLLVALPLDSPTLVGWMDLSLSHFLGCPPSLGYNSLRATWALWAPPPLGPQGLPPDGCSEPHRSLVPSWNCSVHDELKAFLSWPTRKI
ncbi:hypothetical protein H1C71_018625 [Ictidomys tridecemlineatus]|nr:hypothetical protein H1C71_018625 [Ictidomys tridecemlineatus]